MYCSTVSYNFRHRFTQETIEAVFCWILEEAGNAGALTPEAVFIDGTYIKASANLNKKIKQEALVAAKRYQEELLAEINADREAHGKKPFDDDDGPSKPTGKKRDKTLRKELTRRKKAGGLSRQPANVSIFKTLCVLKVSRSAEQTLAPQSFADI